MTKERTELATPYLSGLLEFWLTKSVAGRPPVPASISPADLRPWKDNIVVFEVMGEESGTFVYSYYGKALAAAFGQSRLGATLDDLPPEQRAVLQPEYETVRRERQPLARVHTAVFGERTRSFERLVLPMSSDGDTIDKLLVAAYETTPRDLAAGKPTPGGIGAGPAACGPAPVAGPESDAKSDRKPGPTPGHLSLIVSKPGASA